MIRKKSIFVIGVDPSTKHLQAVVSRPDGTDLGIFSLTLPKDKYERVHKTYEWAAMLGQEMVWGERQATVIYVFIEEPLTWGSGTSTIALARINGALIAGFLSWECKVYDANNQRWKKEVIGKGGVDKTEIARTMRKVWPTVYRMADGNQDILDAAAINRYGAEIVKRTEKIVERNTASPRRVIRRKPPSRRTR